VGPACRAREVSRPETRSGAAAAGRCSRAAAGAERAGHSRLGRGRGTWARARGRSWAVKKARAAAGPRRLARAGEWAGVRWAERVGRLARWRGWERCVGRAREVKGGGRMAGPWGGRLGRLRRWGKQSPFSIFSLFIRFFYSYLYLYTRKSYKK
jgi:hypothetical protein